MRKKSIFVAGISGVALLLLACAGAAEPAYQVVSAARISPGSPIAPPAGEVILTISGDIGITNVGDTLQLDMPTLESLGLVEYAVTDPYRIDEDGQLEQITYTGVLMSRLREYLGVPESSKAFHIVALDDYRVDLSIALAERWPILLATRSDGEYMSVENSGPTRIIFPYDNFKEIDQVKYNPQWIWNIESMRID